MYSFISYVKTHWIEHEIQFQLPKYWTSSVIKTLDVVRELIIDTDAVTCDILRSTVMFYHAYMHSFIHNGQFQFYYRLDQVYWAICLV